MIEPAKKFITPEEYLTREEKSDHRHEYCDGEMFAMAGGTLNHNRIGFNVAKAFDRLFEHKPCRVFINDVRLYIKQSELYTYPDVMVVCGKIEFLARRDDTLLNPILIVEVWSDSTKSYDRGEKFAMYRHIPTLQEYVMIDQTRSYVEHFRREGHFWVLETLEQMDARLVVRALECEIPLTTIYDQVEWQNENDAR